MDEAVFDEMMKIEGDTMVFAVHRERDQHGRSFSRESMDVLTAQVGVYVGTRLLRRWNATNEPPTFLSVEVKVTVG